MFPRTGNIHSSLASAKGARHSPLACVSQRCQALSAVPLAKVPGTRRRPVSQGALAKVPGTRRCAVS
ncbi:MAG: hypothetical protein KGS49_12945 [Planctomycetes bacterium]|nr:hypothetical protein [Planctomycetota bacterium]